MSKSKNGGLAESENDLPVLPKDWAWTTVDDLLTLIDYRGRTPPYSDEGVPHLRSANVKNGKIVWKKLRYVDEEAYESFMTRGIPQAGDVLFTTESPLGDVALVPEQRFSLAQRLLILRPPLEVMNDRFLMYQIMDSRFQGFLRLRGTGSTVTGISSRNFKQVPLCVAPPSEQKRIVSKIEELFSDLDAGVSALKRARARARANLRRYRASALKSAVEGRLTAAWRKANKTNPGVEPASELLARILRDCRQRWEQQLATYESKGKKPPKNWQSKYKEPAAPDTANLPELPTGWCWATIQQCSSFESNAITDGPFGSNLKTEHYTDEGPRVIRLNNIGDGEFKYAEAHISQEHYETLSKHQVEADDLIIAMLGETLPRACVIPADFPPAIVKADCARFSAHRELLQPRYANIVLNACNSQARIETNCRCGTPTIESNKGPIASDSATTFRRTIANCSQCR